MFGLTVLLLAPEGQSRKMDSKEFLQKLQGHAATFAQAVATNEGEWIIKGFIDVYRRIYTISVDTKIVSKVLELLLFPMFVEFGTDNGLKIELCPQQNFYPDLTFTHGRTGRKFAVDIKSTYRTSDTEVKTYWQSFRIHYTPLPPHPGP